MPKIEYAVISQHTLTLGKPVHAPIYVVINLVPLIRNRFPCFLGFHPDVIRRVRDNQIHAAVWDRFHNFQAVPLI